VLDYTVVPATVSAETAVHAQHLAGQIAAALGHVGVLGVEFFVLDDGRLVVNEMAPRPHNSGHHTIDACVTSQFGQQWRSALGLPLGDPSPTVEAVAMCNLLGDLWANGEPRWEVLQSTPDAYLHLYGKSLPKPGRKMGHLTVTAQTADQARRRVLELRSLLVQVPGEAE
jgi:5-(carboxyamino)imidazole ribonucleotide synthase